MKLQIRIPHPKGHYNLHRLESCNAMYDGIRLEGRGEACRRLLASPHLKLFGIFVRETGEATETYVGKYLGMRIKVRQGRFFSVEGSLHKFFNGYYGNGLINSDQFELDKVIEAVRTLSDVLNVPPAMLRVSNLEFGVNLSSDLPVKTILDKMLSHNGRVFRDTSNFEFEGIEAAYTQYRVKVYNKSKPEGLPNKILRIEVSVGKMEFLMRGRSFFLADLCNSWFWNLVRDRFLKIMQEIQFYEPPVNFKCLSERELEFLQRAQYRDYWKTLSPNQACKLRADLSRIVSENKCSPTMKDVIQTESASVLFGLWNRD